MPDTLLRIPVDALGALHRALATGRTPGEAAETARRLGYEAGPGFFAAFHASAGEPRELDEEVFWAELSDFFASLGWGHLEFERLHPGVAGLSSDDWAEANAAGSPHHPACHLTTGLLSDLLGRVGDTDLAVMEVECRARGDERCRFLLGGRDTLERVYEEIRAGASTAESIRRLG